MKMIQIRELSDSSINSSNHSSPSSSVTVTQSWYVASSAKNGMLAILNATSAVLDAQRISVPTGGYPASCCRTKSILTRFFCLSRRFRFAFTLATLRLIILIELFVLLRPQDQRHHVLPLFVSAPRLRIVAAHREFSRWNHHKLHPDGIC